MKRSTLALTLLCAAAAMIGTMAGLFPRHALFLATGAWVLTFIAALILMEPERKEEDENAPEVTP